MFEAFLFASIYTLGAFNHYMTTYSILYLSEQEPDHHKILLSTLIWPINALATIGVLLTTKDDEEE